MKSFLLSLFAMLSVVEGQSQRIKPLTVGDTVPDIEIKNIINFKTDKARISDFKGKLLILDFWATWCSPCIAAFPKLDSLQKEFGAQIQVLSITEQEGKIVIPFLSKMEKATHVKTVSVTDDKVLSRLFKHIYLPHYVWINQEGKVIAITDASEVNRGNIGKVLSGYSVSLSEKKDKIEKVIKSVPAFSPSIEYTEDGKTELEKISGSDMISYSVLTKHMEGFLAPGAMFQDSTFINVHNRTIYGLYKVALFGNSIKMLNSSPSTIIVEIPDSLLHESVTGISLINGKSIKGLEYFTWAKDNTYCYEIKTYPLLAKEKYSIMLDELNRYFGALHGIEGLTEKRNAKYLALIKNTESGKLLSKGAPFKNQIDKFSLAILNGRINNLVWMLSQPLQQYPFIIDETNHKEKIDIELNCQLSDLKAVNKELEKYGLQLIEKEKMMDVAVIRMRKDKAN